MRNLLFLLLLVPLLWTGAAGMAVAAGDPRHEKAVSFWKKAKALQRQGKYLPAAKLFDLAAETEKSAARPRLSDISVELNQAGMCYQDAGHLNLAMQRYREALALARKAGKTGWIPSFLNNMGAVHQFRGEYARAIRPLQN